MFLLQTIRNDIRNKYRNNNTNKASNESISEALNSDEGFIVQCEGLDEATGEKEYTMLWKQK